MENTDKQLNDYEKLWKQVYAEKLLAEQKVELLKRAFNELLDCYHVLGNNLVKDRHTGKVTECNEQSCLAARLMLRNIMHGE